MQTFIILASILALMIGIVVIAIKSTKKTLIPKEIENGVSATAVILTFQKAGGKYSQPSGGLDFIYKMSIGLEVTDETGDSWETKAYEFVLEPQFSTYRIGDTIHIKYDPINKNNVVVDGDFIKRYQP